MWEWERQVITWEIKEAYKVINVIKKLTGNNPYFLLRKQIATNKISKAKFETKK